MLQIVQATFNDVLFADDNSPRNADSFKADGAAAGRELASLWHDALEKMPRGETTDSAVYEVMEALYKACVNFGAIKIAEIVLI